MNSANSKFARLFGRTPLPPWQRAVLFSVAYLVCAEAGRFLSVRNIFYVSFWLPAGLYVSVLLLNERRAWPWLVLAAFPANLVFDLFHGTKSAAIFLFYCANSVQAVTGAWLVRRFVAERPTLATLKELAGLLGFAAVFSPTLGATLGAATLCMTGMSRSFAQSFKIWWGSNAMAILLLAPLMTFFMPQGFSGPALDQDSSVEYVFLLQTFLAVAALVGLIPAVVLGERDRTTAELRESEERFRNLTAAAFEGICISRNGRIVDVNDQMLKMFGRGRAEMIGRDVVELVAPESRAIVAESIRLGREEIYEHRLLRHDGSSFYAEARAKMVRVGEQ